MEIAYKRKYDTLPLYAGICVYGMGMP